MKTLIKNVKTTDYLLGSVGDKLKLVNVLIDGDTIALISESPIREEAEHIIEGGGYFLSPGLCDPQVHFREPGLEYKEDIESGSKAAVKGGFTAVISMPNTTPVADTSETISFMANKASEVAVCDVYPTGAVTKGLQGKELPDFKAMKAAGAIAFTDDGKGVQQESLFKAAMEQAQKLDMPILDHSEDESLSLGGVIHKGGIASKYGVKGIDARSESVHVARGCRLSGVTGCHYHVLHISTAESIEHVREAKRKGYRVTAEVSPHHLLLCDEDIPEREIGELHSNWKMNPPLRSAQDRAACVEALLDGTIDAIATDHAPHAPHEKAGPIEKAPFGIIGLETAFPLIYTNFVKTGKLSLNKCIDLMSKQAGALFGLDMGSIKVGGVANLAIFDLDNEFKVNENFFASKSKNSPFINYVLFGKTQRTFYRGEEVYKGGV